MTPPGIALLSALACMSGPPEVACEACSQVDPSTLSGGYWYDQHLAELWDSGAVEELELGDNCPHVTFPQPGKLESVHRFEEHTCMFSAEPRKDQWMLDLRCDVAAGLGNYWRWYGDDMATLRMAGTERVLILMDVEPETILAAWRETRPEVEVVEKPKPKPKPRPVAPPPEEPDLSVPKVYRGPRD